LDDRRLWLRIDYGNYYASKSFFDSKKGRRIIWGWTNETDSTSDDVAKGWAGIHAIPRTIWLDGDGKRLLQWPIEEVESLRRNEVSHQGLELKKGDLFEIKGTDTLQASSNLPQQKYYVFFFADTVANMAHHFLEAGRCGDRF
jgi:sucrose-6-phosphate hydrolase SacC (GH32 family)